MGKPEKFVRYYCENGADKLIYMDVVASLYGRNSLLDIVKKTPKDIFLFLAVGGGLFTEWSLLHFESYWTKKNKTFVSSDTIAYVMPRERALDIDSESDFISFKAIIDNNSRFHKDFLRSNE